MTERLLSDEELDIKVNTIMHFYSQAHTTKAQMGYKGEMINLINTQKRLYAGSVIGEQPKPFINGEYPKEGDPVIIDLEDNRNESLKFIQDNGAYTLWAEQKARIK